MADGDIEQRMAALEDALNANPGMRELCENAVANTKDQIAGGADLPALSAEILACTLSGVDANRNSGKGGRG